MEMINRVCLDFLRHIAPIANETQGLPSGTAENQSPFERGESVCPQSLAQQTPRFAISSSTGFRINLVPHHVCTDLLSRKYPCRVAFTAGAHCAQYDAFKLERAVQNVDNDIGFF
jgi:hypothetical protein